MPFFYHFVTSQESGEVPELTTTFLTSSMDIWPDLVWRCAMKRREKSPVILKIEMSFV